MCDFDDPSDIDSVELKIQSVSGTLNSTIYANGRHQIPVKIIAKAKKINEITGEEKVLCISNSKWIEMLGLCFAESDVTLNNMGNENWCFTSVKNEFAGDAVMRAQRNIGSAIIILYVYTYKTDLRRLAVNLNTINGKHFTTADNAVGAEQMSISVTSINEINYFKQDLTVNMSLRHSDDRHRLWTGYNIKETFKCLYNNYYIGLKNGLRIVKANTFNYDGSNSNKKWVSVFKNSPQNNEYQIVSHPFDNIEKSEYCGFDNTVYNYVYELDQKVTYNDRKYLICYTLMTFLTHTIFVWNNSIGNVGTFDHHPWFELYDQYGNYGNFSINFTEDLKDIVIENY